MVRNILSQQSFGIAVAHFVMKYASATELFFDFLVCSCSLQNCVLSWFYLYQ